MNVVGPATQTRYFVCSSSIKPARRTTSENRPSVGRYITAKLVVAGGETYLSLIFFASDRIVASRLLPADSTAAASPEVCASSSLSQSSLGNFASIGSSSSPLSPFGR